MPNEAIEAIRFASTNAAQPMIRTCRKLTVGHSLTPDDVDDLRGGADWMEGASLIIVQAGIEAINGSKIVREHDGDVITFVLDPVGVFARAEFPHPMVTVDRDADGEVISVSAVGRFTQPALQIYAEWRKTKTSAEALIVKLANIESTVQTTVEDESLLEVEGFDGGGRMNVFLTPDELVEQLSPDDRRRLVAALYREL